MNRDAALAVARTGRLYPAVILHGATAERRRDTALAFARTLLCESGPDDRPCGACRHCRRVAWPDGEAPFHPDFQVLERDLKTSTSVEATRDFLKAAQLAPFEARGQVFVVASAESLSGEAANALLKVLEEPHPSAPRHFFLLAPSRLDLLATLRSRSLSVFLGPAEAIDREAISAIGRDFAASIGAFSSSRAAIYLLQAAAALGQVGGFDDARASRPWEAAAAAVLTGLEQPGAPRSSLLALAEALLEAPALRLRGIPAERILEGLVARHLA